MKIQILFGGRYNMLIFTSVVFMETKNKKNLTS